MSDRPWVIYTRVSTDDQVREGVSLDMQLSSCRHLAAAGRYQVAREISDPGWSAKDLKRPGMQQLLELAGARAIQGVIVYKLDRLTRSTRDLDHLVESFRRWEVEIISVSEQIHTANATGRLFVMLLGLFAQWEREQIAERVTAGMHHRMSQGGYVGGRVPAGMRVIGPPGGRVLEVDPVEGAKVAPAWSMIAAGKTLRDVGLALDRAGVPCSGKDGWTTQGVHGLITNKRYVGMLVSAADFDRAQEALKARTCPGRRRDSATGGSGAGPRAKASRVWLLSGIARCGRCGSAMVGVSATGGSGGLYHYYRCTGRVHGGKNRCMQPDLSADRWEPAVIEALGRVVRKGGDLGPALIDVQRRLQQAMAPLTAERQALTMELDRIRAEIGRLVDLAASGASVATALAQGLQERQAKVADLEARIGALTGRIAIGALNDDQLQSLISRVHDNLATLEQDTPEEQAKTLRILLTKAVLKPHPKDKGKGEVDLAIDLPSLVSAAFVSPSSMVVLSGMETNALCFSMAVFTGLRRAS